MLKALFFIQHRFDVEDIEITRQDQPQLFDFIDRLADEARAPRAHKVYLSARVNAAVFYDLSLLNLIIPSKKNLEIGLGLVNVVTLGELKAVLAHEFGHFAQRSMAVGRWVYISQQIAGHIVARRDALDKLLQQLSRLDLRIAWVGWMLSIIVWSIRSMMDVLFRGVLLAQRALSRQMEFQADLVAVSLTGSDALIHALHKLNAADDAWDKALAFANTEAGAKRGITDLFAVQTRIIERMREILNQPLYGQVPPLPATARDRIACSRRSSRSRRACGARIRPAPTARTTPNNVTSPAPVDERSAWEVFRNPQALKEQMSAHVFRNATVEPTAMEKTFQQLEKQYGRAFLNRAYRGVYLHRSPVRYADTVDALYGAAHPSGQSGRALDSLYPGRSRAQGRAAQREAGGENTRSRRCATRSRRRRAASSATTARRFAAPNCHAPSPVSSARSPPCVARSKPTTSSAAARICRRRRFSKRAGRSTCARSRPCCTTRTTPKRTCATCRDTWPTSTASSPPMDA